MERDSTKFIDPLDGNFVESLCVLQGVLRIFWSTPSRLSWMRLSHPMGQYHFQSDHDCFDDKTFLILVLLHDNPTSSIRMCCWFYLFLGANKISDWVHSIAKILMMPLQISLKLPKKPRAGFEPKGWAAITLCNSLQYVWIYSLYMYARTPSCNNCAHS